MPKAAVPSTAPTMPSKNEPVRPTIQAPMNAPTM